MDTRTGHPLAWKLLLGALGGALLSAAWAYAGGGDCASCEEAAELVHGKTVALVGILYYSALLVSAFLLGPHPCVYGGILIASGVHAGLVALLIQARVFCPPCILAALSALVSLVLGIRCEPANAIRASLVLPGVALLVEIGVLLGGPLPAPAESRPQAAALKQEPAQAPVPPGRVHLVIYSRPDCGYCIELDRDVLPGVVRDFGTRLEIERRSAEGLPGIPTPTLILNGHADRYLFPGLPSTEKLRSTIETLMGEGDGPKTVLKESR